MNSAIFGNVKYKITERPKQMELLLRMMTAAAFAAIGIADIKKDRIRSSCSAAFFICWYIYRVCLGDGEYICAAVVLLMVLYVAGIVSGLGGADIIWGGIIVLAAGYDGLVVTALSLAGYIVGEAAIQGIRGRGPLLPYMAGAAIPYLVMFP